MKTSGIELKAGTNNLKFKISSDQCGSVKDCITMKFWNSESDRNFIFFNTNQKSFTV